MTRSNGTVAEIVDVYKIYKENGLETVALRGISLNLCEREILAVVGPSGSGKSTLLGILGGMIHPTSGEVYWSVCKDDISKSSPEKIIKFRRRFAGFIFQEDNLLQSFTALQNVELTAKIAGLPDFRAEAMSLLEKVGLGSRMKFYPDMLSSGERKRVEIANALVTSPKIVFADEPTGNLDFSTSEDIFRLFNELNQELGTSFFIVTHSQQIESIAQKVYELRDGMFVGTHVDNIDIASLDKSRILNLDNSGRLTISPHLLNQIGNPTSFRAEVRKGRIILTPKNADYGKSPRTIVCRLCGEVIDKTRTVCPNCGIALDSKSCT